MQYPRIKRSLPITESDSGQICIGELKGFSKIIENPTDWFRALLALLDGNHQKSEILKTLKTRFTITNSDKVITNTILQLQHFGLIEDANETSSVLSADELQRYDRQILQFSLISNSNKTGIQCQEILKKTSVTIFGVGGWGTWIAAQLALLGIGKIRLIDGDSISATNLNRQILFKDGHLGLKKTDAAKSALLTLNPYTQIESINSFEPFNDSGSFNTPELKERILGSDLVILGWSNTTLTQENNLPDSIHQICIKQNIPIVEMNSSPKKISVGPLFSQRKNSVTYATYKTYLQQLFSQKSSTTYSIEKKRFAYNELNESRDVQSWQSVPYLAITSGLICDQLVKFLLSPETCKLTTGRFLLDLDSLESKFESMIESLP